MDIGHCYFMPPLSLLRTDPCSVELEVARKKQHFFPQSHSLQEVVYCLIQDYNFHITTSSFMVLYRCFILDELCRNTFDLQKYLHFTKYLEKLYTNKLSREMFEEIQIALLISPSQETAQCYSVTTKLGLCHSQSCPCTCLLWTLCKERMVWLGGAVFVCTCALEL